MKNYELFKATLKSDLEKAFAEGDISVEIEERKIDKLNKSYEALSVKQTNGDTAVAINVTSMFERQKEGGNYDEMKDIIIENVRSSLEETPVVDISDYEKIRDKLSLRVVSEKRNWMLLRQMPHKVIADLAIVYCINWEDGGNNCLVVIDNKVMQRLGVTKETLERDAIENASKKQPLLITSMREMFKTLGFPVDAVDDDMEVLPLHVATTDNRIYGASVIAYPGFFDEAARVMGGSFYLIPSSVHEVLLLPDTEDAPDVASIKMIIGKVNREEVIEEEQLSYNVYHYDTENKLFEIAEDTEKKAV